jgi:hypothetical protein
MNQMWLFLTRNLALPEAAVRLEVCIRGFQTSGFFERHQNLISRRCQLCKTQYTVIYCIILIQKAN